MIILQIIAIALGAIVFDWYSMYQIQLTIGSFRSDLAPGKYTIGPVYKFAALVAVIISASLVIIVSPKEMSIYWWVMFAVVAIYSFSLAFAAFRNMIREEVQ